MKASKDKVGKERASRVPSAYNQHVRGEHMKTNSCRLRNCDQCNWKQACLGKELEPQQLLVKKKESRLLNSTIDSPVTISRTLKIFILKIQ